MKDKDFMRRAIELARRSNPSPNPMVGCAIVKDDKIISDGFHRRAGLPHAEIEALKKLKKNEARGATLYVNLEPCCHYGRTPPCTDAIISAGIKRVVAAMQDPNPLVSGKGFRALKKAGVDVSVGVLRDEATQLNEVYAHYIKKEIPFVILKTAMSLDGKIATSTGESKWITGGKARKMAHKLRGRVDAVLVGVETILKDNPQLTCRARGGRNPLRIVVDSRLRIPLNSRVLADGNVLIATTRKHSKQRKKKLEELGVDVWIIGEKDGRVDLKDLMKVLGEVGVTSVLIEGGGEVNASALKSEIVNKIVFFIAPKIIGGRDAKTAVEGEGIKRLSNALHLTNVSKESVGEDILITGYIKKRRD